MELVLDQVAPDGAVYLKMVHLGTVVETACIAYTGDDKAFVEKVQQKFASTVEKYNSREALETKVKGVLATIDVTKMMEVKP